MCALSRSHLASNGANDLLISLLDCQTPTFVTCVAFCSLPPAVAQQAGALIVQGASSNALHITEHKSEPFNAHFARHCHELGKTTFVTNGVLDSLGFGAQITAVFPLSPQSFGLVV